MNYQIVMLIVTSKNGKYIIPVSEIYNGKLANGKNKNSVADLREGDEVVYTDGNGNTIPCIVLYDSTGSYGIQIISKDTVGSNITLGSNSSFNEAKLAYNPFGIMQIGVMEQGKLLKHGHKR